MAKCTPFYLKYKRFTMITRLAYTENLALIAAALNRAALKNGAIVECGTWRGGMSAGMIEVGGRDRQYLFFDSFEGLPPARELDGAAAMHWQANVTSRHYFDNCRASLQDFERTIALTGISLDCVEIRKGFFADTFPTFQAPSIAVLRLDGDWYDSTMECLEKFWDHVIPGGLIIIDDYYTWDGCCRAVHDFLAKRQATERLSQGPIGKVAYIRKR
jgi:O-methyltransferase